MTNVSISREVVEQIIAFVSEARKQGYHFDCISPTRLYATIGEADLSAAAEPVKAKCGPECDRICQQPSGYGDCRKIHRPAPAVPDADYPCRDDGRCQYAIDSGAEGAGHCPKGKCVMAVPDAAKPETQGERHVMPIHIYLGMLAETVKSNGAIPNYRGEIHKRLKEAAALLSAGPARVEPMTDEYGPFLCLSPICGPTCCDCNHAISKTDQTKYAMRYAYLRSRNLNAIQTGGVFAGMTPSNVVLSGDDLDNEVDRAIEAAHGIGKDQS